MPVSLAVGRNKSSSSGRNQVTSYVTHLARRATKKKENEKTVAGKITENVGPLSMASGSMSLPMGEQHGRPWQTWQPDDHRLQWMHYWIAIQWNQKIKGHLCSTYLLYSREEAISLSINSWMQSFWKSVHFYKWCTNLSLFCPLPTLPPPKGDTGQY